MQRPVPYPTDWWGRETFMGLTRNEIAMALIWISIVAVYASFDWDHVFGRRHHMPVATQQVAKK